MRLGKHTDFQPKQRDHPAIAISIYTRRASSTTKWALRAGKISSMASIASGAAHVSNHTVHTLSRNKTLLSPSLGATHSARSARSARTSLCANGRRKQGATRDAHALSWTEAWVATSHSSASPGCEMEVLNPELKRSAVWMQLHEEAQAASAED